MKSQRRHELQTNILANWLGEKLEQAKPYMKTVFAVLVTVLAVYGVWLYISSQQGSQMAEDWRGYFDGYGKAIIDQDPEPLEDLAHSLGNTPAGLWASKSAADLVLAEGNRSLFRDRDMAEQSLRSALDMYVALESKAQGDAMLLDRVRLGIAQANESLNESKEAQKYYKVVINTASEQVLRDLAQNKLDDLVRPDSRKFAMWFSKQDPLTAMQDFLSSQRQARLPDDLEDLSDRPDLGFPGFSPEPEQDEPLKEGDPTGPETAGPETAGPSKPTASPTVPEKNDDSGADQDGDNKDSP